MAVITISRELGSGGTDIAQRVAHELGYQLVGHELVDMIAARLGVRPESAEQMDEKAFGWLSAVVDSLLRSMEGESLTVESYRYVAARVLRELARQGDVVILGRAGQTVLAKSPRSLHVHITAPFEVRVERIAKNRELAKAEAHRLVEASDRDRRGYVQQVGGVDWSDPLLYDLVVNTNRLSIEAAADILLVAARHRGAQPVSGGETPEG